MSEAEDSGPAPGGGEARRDNGLTVQRPVVVAILYLINVFIGFSVIVGVILAYVWRSDRDTQEWEKSHYTYLIRTFWIGLAVFAVTAAFWISSFVAVLPAEGQQAESPGAVVAVFFSIFAVWLAMAGWFCARCVLSLVRSGRREPMPRPETWLF